MHVQSARPRHAHVADDEERERERAVEEETRRMQRAGGLQRRSAPRENESVHDAVPRARDTSNTESIGYRLCGE